METDTEAGPELQEAHKLRISEHSQEQIENGSSRDFERVGIWEGANGLYVLRGGV